MSSLDIWAIQSNPSELYTAIDTLKSDKDIIVYSNLICDFTIGSEIIKTRQFDTIVYSEENDFLGMFMRGGKVDKTDIFAYLDKKGLKYTEVTFAPSIAEYEDDCSFLDIWVAREEYVLQDALEDTINKGNNLECDYFPNLSCNLDLSYLTNSSSEKNLVDGRIFQGVITMKDKIILLVSQGAERNVTPDQVIELTTRLGIKCNIYNNEDFSLSLLHKQNKLL